MSDTSAPALPPLERCSVAVVIPTHQRRSQVLGVVRLVLEDRAATEVIVVADRCTDGTAEALRELAENDPRLVVVEVDHGNQFRSLDAGFQLATSEVIVQLDDDVWPRPGLITGHAIRHTGADRLLVLGYMPTVTDPPRKPGQFASYLYAAEYERQCGEYEEDANVIFTSFWAGNFSIRRDDALRVGLDPGALGSGALGQHADKNFGLRCFKDGLTAVFDRDLLADHRHSRLMEAFFAQANRNGLGLREVHDRYADTIGPLDAAMLSAGLPAVGRLAARLGRNRSLRRIELPILRALTVVAGKIHWWKGESFAGGVAAVVIEIGALVDE